ncbi:crystallin [Limnochorda pilosa]|uniref:Crystallin n=1 Tax=Limnochorda pilosa TaxID=1555112 RepID=A0A0K2SLJ2_LIMPI|nr:crystallin [Limnochorda pilosa]
MERRIYGGWLGKAVGVAYGSPVEGWTYEQIQAAHGDLVEQRDRFYLVPMDRLFGADDDTSHPVLMLQAVAETLRGNPAASMPGPRELGQWWLNLIPEDHGVIWRGGYAVSTEHTAFLNLLAGVEAPHSGSAALNGPVVSQQIGGQIFSDVWGLLAPGRPELAAAWADAAASVSHDLDGRVGARFLAAMVSLAFRSSTVEDVVRQALELLPAGARYTQVVHDVHRFWREHPDDWHQARAYIAATHGYDRYPGICHIIPNAAVVAMALLYGRGDFDRTLRVANAAGWDTDCNVGNAAAVVGVLVGPEGIPRPWREPLQDRVVGSGVLGARNLWSIAALARLTAAAGKRLEDPTEPPTPDLIEAAAHRASFDWPGSTESMRGERSSEQAAQTVSQTDERAAAGAGSLKVVVKGLSLHRPARVVLDLLPTPSDLTHTAYDPGFSPSLLPGQRVAAHMWIPGDGGGLRGSAPEGERGPAPVSGLVAGFFVDVLEAAESGSRRRRIHAEAFTPLEPERWARVAWQVPALDGFVERLGIEVRCTRPAQTYDGSLFLDELTWGGPARFGLRFRGWPAAFGAAAGWTYSKGSWRVEDGAYVGSCSDHGESFTGSPDWTDASVEAEIAPEHGGWHLVLVRAQGARRWYAAGLAPDGQLVIVRQRDGLLDRLAAAPFPWEPGAWYRVTVAARGAEIVAEAARAAVGRPERDTEGHEDAGPRSVRLRWRESSPDIWNRGCVGLAVREGSRMACRRMRVEGETRRRFWRA